MNRGTLMILTTASFREKLSASLPRVSLNTIVDLTLGTEKLSVGCPLNDTFIQAFSTPSVTDHTNYDLYSKAVAIGYEHIVEKKLLEVRDMRNIMFFDDLGNQIDYPFILKNSIGISYVPVILSQLELFLHCFVWSNFSNRLEVLKSTDIPYLLFGTLTKQCQTEFLEQFSTMCDASVNYLLSHVTQEEFAMLSGWATLPKYSNSMLILSEVAAKLRKQ